MPEYASKGRISMMVLSALTACLIIAVQYGLDMSDENILKYRPFAMKKLNQDHRCHSELSDAVDLSWHPPRLTDINNLTTVINGTGIYGFIFNTSKTPPSLPYGTCNWCNMPHVRVQEYVVPPAEYKLEYVEVIHRHHKRTPYAANLFPNENDDWNCDDESLFSYAVPHMDGKGVKVNSQIYTSDSNPFMLKGSEGNCRFPQITAEGLLDSRQHGKDLFAVYHDLLNFLPGEYDATKIKFRVTNNVITSQIAGQVVLGMYPSMDNRQVPVSVQPASVDSLEPSYDCLAARGIRRNYSIGGTMSNWTRHLAESKDLFRRLDAVSGVNSSDPSWHEWFDHYFDNLSSRLCYQKALPCHPLDSSLCVTQEDANAVFRRGQYEYSFVYRDSPHSLNASAADFGVWMAELASNLREAMDKGGPHTHPAQATLYRHNIAHDGSISRLLSILQVDVMFWPGMGAELVFELFSKRACWFIRILWGGQVLKSSNPSLGMVDLIPVETLLAYIDGLVGTKGAKVPALCSEKVDVVSV